MHVTKVITQAPSLVKVDFPMLSCIKIKHRSRQGRDRKKKHKRQITMYNLAAFLTLLLACLVQLANALPTNRLPRSQALEVGSEDPRYTNIMTRSKKSLDGNPDKLNRRDGANPNVVITVHNTLPTNKPIYFYISGVTDLSGSESVLLSDGTWQVLNAGGVPTPVAIAADVTFVVPPQSSTTVTLPGYANSSRLYAFEGTPMTWSMVGAASGLSTVVQPVVTVPGSPAYESRWGFIEFTSNHGEFFVNLSFVDFVALAFGISLVEEDGNNHAVPGLMQTLPGQPKIYSNSTISSSGYPSVTAEICAGLEAQAVKDGNNWGALCIYDNTTTSPVPSGVPLRVLSPQDASEQGIPFASPTYYDAYIAEVWAHYTTNSLTIDTQVPWLGTSGVNKTLVSCQVDAASDNLYCSNSATPMPRPVTADIWGCNTGAFAIGAGADGVFKAVVPRVCAAFSRSTFLVEGGNVQPGPANWTFYGAGQDGVPTNQYARLVHQAEVVGGYAFAYDDVGVAGEDQEGAIEVGSARSLNVYIGQ